MTSEEHSDRRPRGPEAGPAASGKGRSGLWLAIRVSAGIFLVFAAVCSVIVWSLFRDEAAPDDSDMVVARRQPAAAENGFEDLPPETLCDDSVVARLVEIFWREQEATADEDADEVDEDFDEDFDEADEDLEAWDDALVEQLLGELEPLFAAVDRGLAKPDFVVPQLATYDCCPQELRRLRLPAGALELRLASRVRAGDSQGALDDALRLVRLGQRIEDGQGSLVPFLIGNSVKNIGLARVEFLARRGFLSRQQCLDLVPRLARFEVRKEAVQTAVRGEYGILVRYLNGSRAEFDGTEFAWLERRLVKPNVTRRRFLASYDELIERQERPFRGEVERLGSGAVVPARSVDRRRDRPALAGQLRAPRDARPARAAGVPHRPRPAPRWPRCARSAAHRGRAARSV